MADNEVLATGWEPSGPNNDTLLRAFNLNMAETYARDAELLGHRTLRTDAFWLADYGVPSGFGNVGVLLQPLSDPNENDHRPDRIMDAIEGFFAGGRGDVYLFSSWPTPDLRRRGWHLYGHPPWMVRPAGPPSPAPVIPPGIRIQPVITDAQLADYERTFVEAFPMSEAAGLLPGGLFPAASIEEEGTLLFVAYEAGEPVATAGGYIAYGVSDVTAVSTVPHARGRGIGAAVTWAVTLADPTVPAALIASDLGRPVYERMGYLPLLRYTLWGTSRA